VGGKHSPQGSGKSPARRRSSEVLKVISEVNRDVALISSKKGIKDRALRDEINGLQGSTGKEK